MFYTIYKITNKINGKIYIGKHQTKDLEDGYMGSGKLIKAAIQKYGLKNFIKEILYVFDNEGDMNAKEAELITEEFVKEGANYNICPGGKGGWGYINSNEYLRTKGHDEEMYFKISKRLKGRKNPENSLRLKILHREGKVRYDTFTGKSHTDEAKSKIGLANSINQSGSKNSQFGTMWITNGSKNKKIKKSDPIPKGYWRGAIHGPPIFGKIEKCSKCLSEEKDLYWWNEYSKSGLSISRFVKEVYPYNRASFYNMKSRIFS